MPTIKKTILIRQVRNNIHWGYILSAPPNTLSMLGLLIFIVTYLYHSRPRKMGNSHYIGKRHIFVSRRDCRNAPVFCQRGKSSFFAYPMGGGKFVIHTL